MIGSSNQQREEATIVDLSFANLSRKCSNCGQAGHNSRTCLESREPAVSEADYKSSIGDSVITHVPALIVDQVDKLTREEDGEVSDCSGTVTKDIKKKGVAWTEEEHKLFLQGLQKLGKGDWRGISRQYVQTRSPTQVASHAQKYFIRQSVAGKRKRRSSLFDLIPEGIPEVKSQATQAVPECQKAPDQASLQSCSGKSQQGFSYPSAPIPHPSAPIQGPDALAFAYWYQNLLMQQGSMAWLQAMHTAQNANCFPSNNIPFPRPGCASSQGFPSMGEAGIASVQDRQMAANLAAQQQAVAFMAQQQITAAVTMGAFPFGAPAAATHGPSGSASCKPAAPDASYSGSAHLTENADSTLANIPNNIARPSLPSTVTAQNDQMQPRNPFLSPELFGNGKLVRPRAQRAQSTQTLGNLPSYMLPSQHEAPLASCSKDSGETHALMPGCGTQAEASLCSTDPRPAIGFYQSACREKPAGSEGSRTLRFATE